MIESFVDFFEFQFLTYALVGTILLSIICGAISPLVIARKQSFMVAAVAHSTLLGAAIGLAIFGNNNPLALFFTTLIITIFLSLFLAHWSFEEKVPTDGLIGVFFTTTMGLGIIIHQIFSKNTGDLMGLLFGNILLISNVDLIFLFIILILTMLALYMPFQKWIYSSYDPIGAKVSGINTYFFHILFMSLLTTLVVASMKLAGTVLINTLLLVPGLFALKFSKSVKGTFTLSLLFSAVASIIGIYISNLLNTPSGATLAVTHFLLLILSIPAKKALAI